MGPRVLTRKEANALVPRLEEAFREFDALRERSRQTKVKMTALEMIWGEAVSQPSCADHGEWQHHLETMEKLNNEFGKIVAGIEELGGSVKGLEQGLVDFFGVLDGRLVCLCWQRGEDSIGFWHHVDTGFAGRQPLPPAA